MGVFFYNIFLGLFRFSLLVASLFNNKAKLWVSGRKGQFRKLEAALGNKGKVIWVHCASLGEFEQGRPLIEKLRIAYPSHRILLTFFSPSGYEVRKNYSGADWVFYLPMDGAGNARRFLEIVNPSLVVFVKYEFWYYYLKKVKYRNIPLILVSAVFWEKMSFFKWYGAVQRKILSRFDHLFVQDAESKRLLDGIGLGSITTVSGDTRFDRVVEIAENSKGLPVIENFLKSAPAIVAGSTWPADEQQLKAVISQHPDLKLIIAPHEIDDAHVESIIQLFPGAVRYSQAETAKAGNVLIIDNFGLLSSLYRYAWITYIGGGFGKGIHNTLEAAVYGKPVVFGPVFQKFREAKELIAAGGAITVTGENELVAIIEKFLRDDSAYRESCKSSAGYVYGNRGATEKILAYIQEKRLLTS